ncbi:unnamed protein product [Calypogeia fissa]
MEAMGGTAPDLLTAAFLSMQSPSTVVAFTREVGGGFITPFAQRFFLDKCFNNEVHLRYPASQSYVKRVVKAIIMAAESDREEVMEDLYGLHSIFLDLDKGSPLAERCYTTLTFVIPESARANLTPTLGPEMASDLIGTKLLTVRTSLNMLDGDTGYNIWPAGLFLAQVLLSHPQLVHGRSCIELGSGTGICGVWLSMLAPSKAVLTDGALQTLANLRHNLDINGIPISDKATHVQETRHGETSVECRQLLWETASEEEVLSFRAQVILGADLIYDPTIVPHLVRVLAMMLQEKSPRQGLSAGSDSDEGKVSKSEDDEVLAPVAYLASALRNLTTLHLFFNLADSAGLEVTDVTEPFMPLRILPEIYDWDRSQIRFYKVVSP